jgi:putative ABC transport system permease protein
MMIDMLLIIGEQSLLYFPLILGAYISISLIKVPDLSIESAYVFGAITATRLLPLLDGVPSPVVLVIAIIASMIGGMVVGCVSSVLTKIARIPHLLSSILTSGLFHGINQWFLGTALFSLNGFKNPLILFASDTRGPELIVLFAVFLLLTVVGARLLRTQLGYAFAMYGNNPNLFDHYGISSRYVFVIGIMLSNALAGMAGYFVAQSSGFSDVNAGSGMALFCVTCLILGKMVRASRINASILVPIAGIILYCALQQGLLKIGFNLKYFTMIQSLIVLLVLVYKYHKAENKNLTVDNLGV